MTTLESLSFDNAITLPPQKPSSLRELGEAQRAAASRDAAAATATLAAEAEARRSAEQRLAETQQAAEAQQHALCAQVGCRYNNVLLR